MKVPKQDDFYLPLLIYARERNSTFAYRGAKNFICNELEISKTVQKERYANGRNKFDTRLSWAVKYLYEARLLKRVQDGFYIITDRGLDLLEENHKKITKKHLMKFREFREFMGKESDSKPDYPNQHRLTDFKNNALKMK